jgi:hypothetical protein
MDTEVVLVSSHTPALFTNIPVELDPRASASERDYSNRAVYSRGWWWLLAVRPNQKKEN